MPGGIVAEEELAVEELHTHHGKDEEKQHVNNENVEHIFQRDHNTVEHSLQRGNAVHHFERPQNTKEFEGFQLLANGCAPEIEENTQCDNAWSVSQKTKYDCLTHK